MGRPKKQIDYKLVEDLASIQCTQEEIAKIVDISVRTLQRDKEFCHIYKKGIENGKKSLRRLQFEKAEQGNVSMLIWLGKQYLGQKEEPTEKIDKLKAETTKLKKEAKKLDQDIESNSYDDGVVIINDAK